MIRASIFASFVLATPCGAQALFPDAARAVSIVDVAVACKSPEDLRKAVQMSSDEEAFKKFLAGKIIGGTCLFFEVGDNVYVTEAAATRRQYKVRKTGDRREFWVYENALK